MAEAASTWSAVTLARPAAVIRRATKVRARASSTCPLRNSSPLTWRGSRRGAGRAGAAREGGLTRLSAPGADALACWRCSTQRLAVLRLCCPPLRTACDHTLLAGLRDRIGTPRLFRLTSLTTAPLHRQPPARSCAQSTAHNAPVPCVSTRLHRLTSFPAALSGTPPFPPAPLPPCAPGGVGSGARRLLQLPRQRQAALWVAGLEEEAVACGAGRRGGISAPAPRHATCPARPPRLHGLPASATTPMTRRSPRWVHGPGPRRRSHRSPNSSLLVGSKASSGVAQALTRPGPLALPGSSGMRWWHQPVARGEIHRSPVLTTAVLGLAAPQPRPASSTPPSCSRGRSGRVDGWPGQLRSTKHAHV